jgi:surfactin family lipopeptide synthetase A
MSKESRLSEAKQRLLELQRQGNRPRTTASLTKRSNTQQPVPLSFAQDQLWKLDKAASVLAPLHSESITIHRHGSCDVEALEKSFAEIIRRHEIWRTTFEVINGEPVQVVHPPSTFKLPVTDLRNLPEHQRARVALELASQDAREPFVLGRGPLVRAHLVRLSDTEHRLFVSAHQIVVDGITVFDIFPSELTNLYEAFVTGKPSPLPELPFQYADYAWWQRHNLTGAALDAQLAYWERQLAGTEPLEWPKGGKRPPQQSYRGAIQAFQLSRDLSDSLRSMSRKQGASLFVIFITSLMALLRKYTSQEDIVVGTLAPAGRERIEFQGLIGYFLNPVPLRAKLSGDLPFSSLLEQIRRATLGAISNCDVTLEGVGKRLQLKPDPSRSPFFTVALSVAPDVPKLPSGWDQTYMDVESGGARWDLYIELSDRPGGIIGRAQYNPDIFTRAELAETLEDFKALLKKAASDPAKCLGEL